MIMQTIGLTGGVGMGKSACAQLLQWRGAAVVDTDELARRVVQPGAPALAELVEIFGRGCLDPAGQLNRAEMARLVFADPSARRKLEAVLHPRIRDLWQTQLAVWRDEPQRLAVVVIPLLFEAGAEGEFDSVWCVACSSATQQQRLRERGWSDEQIQQRLAAQLPIEEKLLRAKHVIWTEGGMDVHAQQVYRLVPPLR